MRPVLLGSRSCWVAAAAGQKVRIEGRPHAALNFEVLRDVRVRANAPPGLQQQVAGARTAAGGFGSRAKSLILPFCPSPLGRRVGEAAACTVCTGRLTTPEEVRSVRKGLVGSGARGLPQVEVLRDAMLGEAAACTGRLTTPEEGRSARKGLVGFGGRG